MSYITQAAGNVFQFAYNNPKTTTALLLAASITSTYAANSALESTTTNTALRSISNFAERILDYFFPASTDDYLSMDNYGRAADEYAASCARRCNILKSYSDAGTLASELGEDMVRFFQKFC